MSVINEVVVGAVTVVPGLGQAPGTSVEASVVLPLCQPGVDVRELVSGVARTLFAQGVSFEVVVVCTEEPGACVHPVADLVYVRVVEAPGAFRDDAVAYAMGGARGVWVVVADAAQADPFEVAEGLHQARERAVELITDLAR